MTGSSASAEDTGQCGLAKRRGAVGPSRSRMLISGAVCAIWPRVSMISGSVLQVVDGLCVAEKILVCRPVID